MTLRRRTLLQAALAGVGATALADISAQTSAGKVVYDYQPGSLASRVGTTALRAMRGQYQPDLGHDMQYIIGNSGARSFIAVHASPADGSTVLYSPSSALSLLGNLRKLPDLDPIRDFQPVIPLAEFTFAFSIGPGVPTSVLSMKDYVAWVHDNPDSGAYGLPGLGTAPHFVGLSLARDTNVSLRSQAYQGYVPLMRDLLSGALPAAFILLGSAPEAEADGRVRALALTSAQRWPTLPSLPTLSELGMAGVTASETFGLFLPAKTAASKVQELHHAAKQALAQGALSGLPGGSLRQAAAVSQPAYADALTLEHTLWQRIVARERFVLPI